MAAKMRAKRNAYAKTRGSRPGFISHHIAPKLHTGNPRRQLQNIIFSALTRKSARIFRWWALRSLPFKHRLRFGEVGGTAVYICPLLRDDDCGGCVGALNQAAKIASPIIARAEHYSFYEYPF